MTGTSKKKDLSLLEAKAKAARYCAYQERTQRQVRDKLYQLGLHTDEVENTLSELIQENYVNEERFARAYAGGKFRMKKWGRNKIKMGLKGLGLTDYCIRKGLEEIDEESYTIALQHLIEKKGETLGDTDPRERQHKLIRYLLSRGYENELIREQLKFKAD
ncbi:MAG: RecX family transcriptional regulator [Cyclobacteriaceae bacterium]|nr:RecX family transcriptional regulator [Cyclobacteriaceae bacterium]